MAAQTSGLTITDVPLGSGVKIGTEQFIAVNRVTDGTLMFRDELLSSTMKMYNSAPSVTDYEGSIVDTYLSTTYLDSFTAQLQSYFVLRGYPCITYDGSSSATKTINRKIVVSNKASLEDSIVLSSLKTYYGVTEDDDSRIAKLSGVATPYWLRDANTSIAERMQNVAATGIFSRNALNKLYGVRPFLTLDPNTPVQIVNGEYVVQ